MKIIILGKRDQMGTTPSIRVKGISTKRYNFLWDHDIRHYAYTPQDQVETDDIFRTQGKIYHHMYFSAWLDEKPKEKSPAAEPPKKVAKPKKPKKPKLKAPAISRHNR